MISKMLWAAPYAWFLIRSALAQDPTKVEPQHYQLAFENEYVQVVNIHYGPREKSALHNHPGGVVVVLTSGHSSSLTKKVKRKRYTPSPASADGFRHSSTQ
jgi:predicted metal-dependent enzyme (double-stranded beta helix superfamily)